MKSIIIANVSLKSFNLADASSNSSLLLNHFLKRILRVLDSPLEPVDCAMTLSMIVFTSSRQCCVAAHKRSKCGTASGGQGTVRAAVVSSLLKRSSTPMQACWRARTCSGALLISLRISLTLAKTVKPKETMPIIALAGSIALRMGMKGVATAGDCMTALPCRVARSARRNRRSSYMDSHGPTYHRLLYKGQTAHKRCSLQYTPSSW